MAERIRTATSNEDRMKIAHEEAQANPIFLLQASQVIVTNSDLEYDSNLESIVDPDTGEQLDDDKLLEKGWAVQVWRTESVWFTREEAEQFAEETSYHYGKGRQWIDWRVYCVLAEGQLAGILTGECGLVENSLIS